jgi:DNA polymerase
MVSKRAEVDSAPRPAGPRRGNGRDLLDSCRQEAAGCTDCDLYARATQTVFGEGPVDARLVLLGEQPGDREDRAGHPFVGPAGRLLDGALDEAGIDRADVYLTNVVKHFKWQARGKVRIHKSPNAREVAACRQWWERELAAIRPVGLVCLGAVAARAVLGTSVRVTRDRGCFSEHPLADWASMTVHPSSILRGDDREEQRARFVADLVGVRRHLTATDERGRR